MQTSLFEQQTQQQKYASALVNIKGLGVKTFSYLIPDEMKDKIQIGQAILVPFGRQGLINAFCVGFSDYVAGDFKVKKISKILDETPLFSIDYLKLLEWVANYYCCDLVTVLNAAIPMKLIEKASKTETLIEFEKYDGATKRQEEILKLLEKSGKMPLILFEKYAKTTRNTIKKLETLGCVKLYQEELYRNPLDILQITQREPLFELSGDQKKVYEGIKRCIDTKMQRCEVEIADSGDVDTSTQPETNCASEPSSLCASISHPEILLHGVTASGKTEVYFKLIDDTIKSGKNVLFLAPEIALASQLTKRLAKKFGTDTANTAFNTGRVLLESSGTWKYSSLDSTLTYNWEMWTTPQDEAGRICLHADHSFMCSTSKNPKAAFQLLRFLTYGPEGNYVRLAMYAEENKDAYILNDRLYYPATTNAEVISRLGELDAFTEVDRYFMDNIKNSFRGDPFKYVPEYNEIHYSYLKSMIATLSTGGTDPTSQLTSAQPTVNKLIADAWKNFENEVKKVQAEFKPKG